MTSFKTILTRSFAVVAAASVLAFVGCGGDDLGKRYYVSGTVKYKGAPVPKAVITFKPVKNEGRGASGEVKDGKYALTTASPNDGAFPGDYQVIVEDIAVDLAAATADTSAIAAKAKIKIPEGMVDQAAQARQLKKAKNSLPSKYGKVDSSGLKATVKEQSNTFDFELVD
jgi:hypothetical protein